MLKFNLTDSERSFIIAPELKVSVHLSFVADFIRILMMGGR